MIQDFHIHSNFSNDGEFTPAQLCAKASEAGCTVIALTDHNSVKGIDKMIAEGSKYHIQVIPGIEIDTTYAGIDFHCAVYGMDYTDTRYNDIHEFYEIQERRTSHEALEKFERHFDISVNRDDLKKIQKEGIVVPEDLGDYFLNHPMYADAEFLKEFREGGTRADNPYLNFYLDYFAAGKIAHVKGNNIEIDEILKLVEETGGVAVIAHPGHNFKNDKDLLKTLVNKKEISGLEVYSNYHTEEMTSEFLQLAQDSGLIVTCGSDYHGKNKPSIQLGSIKYVPEQFESTLVHRIKKQTKES